MLPALDDVSHGFGSLFAQAMDQRQLSRTQMASSLNVIGQESSEQASRQLAERRTNAEADIARLEQEIQDAQALKTVDRHTIQQWERDEVRISPVAVEAIIEVLNSRRPLDDEIADELRLRAEDLNRSLASGIANDIAKDRRFSFFLQELMDDYNITRPDLAAAINVLPQHTKAERSLAEVRALLTGLPESLPEKHYQITVRGSADRPDLRTIDIPAGRITPEHLHLIEAGAAPSADLYALLKQGLHQSAELQPDEIKDLERTFREKQLETGIVSATAQAAAPIPVPDVQPATESNVADDKVPVESRFGITPKGRHTDVVRPAVSHTEPLTRYTEAYMRIFTDNALTPPPSADGNERNKARTEFADRALGVPGKIMFADDETRSLHSKLVRQLRPLTLEPISQEVLDRVHFGHTREKLERLNEATLALREHVFEHSRSGINAHFSLDALKEFLAQYGITTDAQIKSLNNGKTLESIIDLHEMKKPHHDIRRQVERMAERFLQQNELARQEYGSHMPQEFSAFINDGESLQNYHQALFSRFDNQLDEMQSRQAIGRYSAANS